MQMRWWKKGRRSWIHADTSKDNRLTLKRPSEDTIYLLIRNTIASDSCSYKCAESTESARLLSHQFYKEINLTVLGKLKEGISLPQNIMGISARRRFEKIDS